MDRRIADAVEIAKDEWKKIMGEVKAHVAEAQEQQLDLALQEANQNPVLCKNTTSSGSKSTGRVKQIKSKYDHKINEFRTKQPWRID
jgi:hypothetical protein